MKLKELKAQLEGQVGIHNDEKVVVVEAYYLSVLNGEGFIPKLRVIPSDGGKIRIIDLRELK